MKMDILLIEVVIENEYNAIVNKFIGSCLTLLFKVC